MAQIEQAIASAQRRADAQYERAVAEAKRTGRSQDVDGVSLSDEGLAGARIDAESHVTIDVLFNQPSYRFEIASSVEPAPARAGVDPGGGERDQRAVECVSRREGRRSGSARLNSRSIWGRWPRQTCGAASTNATK